MGLNLRPFELKKKKERSDLRVFFSQHNKRKIKEFNINKIMQNKVQTQTITLLSLLNYGYLINI